jgi:RNA polymerase sigma-70 factor (ECF subfamily)
MAESHNERHMVEAAQRDPRHFGALYELHFDRIYAYVVRRVRDRAEAEDLTSEVFHQALAHLSGYEWRGVPFATWLYRIAANAIIDRHARSSRESATPAPEPLTDAGIEEAEHRAGVFRLMRDLPPDQRRVLLMRFREDRSVKEIAAALGRSKGAVKQLQFRGLETLRARIGGRNG